MKREEADAVSIETLAALRGLQTRGELSASFEERLDAVVDALSSASMFDAFGFAAPETEQRVRRGFGGHFVSCASRRHGEALTVDLIRFSSEAATCVGAERIGIVARENGSAENTPRWIAAAQIEAIALGDRLAAPGMTPDDRFAVLYGIVGSALNDAERRAANAARGQVELSGVSIPFGGGHLEGMAMPDPHLPQDPFRQRSRIDHWAGPENVDQPEGQRERFEIASSGREPDPPSTRGTTPSRPLDDLSDEKVGDGGLDASPVHAVGLSDRSSMARARQRAAEMHRRKLAASPQPTPPSPGPVGRGRGGPGRDR